MKNFKLLSIFAFGALLLTFASCNKVKDIADVKFDATLFTALDATSSSEARAAVYPFVGYATIDPTEDETVNEYWSVIKKWNINSIVVKVKAIDQEADLTNGRLIVKDESTEETLYTTNAENMLLTAGTEIINVTEDDWSKITTALEAQHKLSVSVQGELDQPSIHIVFLVEVSTSITANPL